MFTGIVQGIGKILNISKKKKYYTYFVKIPKNLRNKLFLGASISCNGCCLTVKSIENRILSFDIVKETFNITNFNNFKIGSYINLERSLKFNSELGGHIVYGHVMCKAIVKEIKSDKIFFSLLKDEYNKYIFEKGYIAFNGISLTIFSFINKLICVNIIPETKNNTTLFEVKFNDLINIEIDFQTKIIVDTLIRLKKIKKL
ncbi:MAG: riboflavin synthase subunit alpha [Enterobacteriaceae bacterium]